MNKKPILQEQLSPSADEPTREFIDQLRKSYRVGQMVPSKTNGFIYLRFDESTGGLEWSKDSRTWKPHGTV